MKELRDLNDLTMQEQGLVGMANPVEGGKDLVRRAGPGSSGAKSLLIQVCESEI